MKTAQRKPRESPEKRSHRPAAPGAPSGRARSSRPAPAGAHMPRGHQPPTSASKPGESDIGGQKIKVTRIGMKKHPTDFGPLQEVQQIAFLGRQLGPYLSQQQMMEQQPMMGQHKLGRGADAALRTHSRRASVSAVIADARRMNRARIPQSSFCRARGRSSNSWGCRLAPGGL